MKTDWTKKIRELIFKIRLKACIMRLKKYAKKDKVLLSKNETVRQKKRDKMAGRGSAFRIPRFTPQPTI